MTEGLPARWADSAMYRSEPMPKGKPGPRVILLNATPDPLGSLAALTAMYEGKVVRDLRTVSNQQRDTAFDNMMKTALSGPLEVAQFHFLVEGVTRAFTHQMVRERQAFFAQESLRFAVKDNWTEEVPVPPGVAMADEKALAMWREALGSAEQYYSWLIEQGVPAEDARGLLPHAVTTRLHWVLDLRGLLHVAGLRLCTQAQFEWRLVMAQVVKALRKYRHDHVAADDAWQFNRIADALRPVCYQEGRCGFMAQFDRGCTIRERVEANAAIGRPSSKWSETLDVFHVDREQRTIIKAIQPSEWAADPTAARRPT